MLSAPDKVDVKIPTVSSTGNLRQLAAAMSVSDAGNNNKGAVSANNNSTQNQAVDNTATVVMPGRSRSNPNGPTPTPPPVEIHHHNNNNNSNSRSEESSYSPWMVGSTEFLSKALNALTTGQGWCGPTTMDYSHTNINSNGVLHHHNHPHSSASSSPVPTEITTATTTSPSLSSTPTPHSPTINTTTTTAATLTNAQPHQSLLQNQYHTTLLTTPTPLVESLLATTCNTLNFDIAEMWLRTGPKTHQLTHSHVRPTALDESVRQQLVDVYYGERSNERTHRLSPALCKRAKEAGEVIWVTAQTRHGAEALKCSISDVRTAVAVPICHLGAGVNVTIIYFSIRRAVMKRVAVEFLTSMSLSVAVASVNSLAEEVMVVDEEQPAPMSYLRNGGSDWNNNSLYTRSNGLNNGGALRNSYSGSGGMGGVSTVGGTTTNGGGIMTAAQASAVVESRSKLSKSCSPLPQPPHHHHQVPNKSLVFQGSDPRATPQRLLSVTGAQLNLQWESLRNVEYLTDGGNNWIHTAVFQGKSVVVKTLKPECQDVALAINEIEGELEIHSRLDHPNIVKLIGAGFTPRGVRFVVLERLDGGTLTQLLGYDTRIRDRRRRFWAKKKISYVDVLKCARSLAEALAYCHGRAIPNAMVLHRDLKPDNVGFTLDGTVKLIDFGLARTVENATISNEIYEMSGETGSLRYMSPEVASCQPYNQKADVYSFGIILWELVANKKPYDGMNRDEFYSRVVHGGERPVINTKKWPVDLIELMKSCWDTEIVKRPDFADIVDILDGMLSGEKDGLGNSKKKKSKKNFVSTLIDRHSTWF